MAFGKKKALATEYNRVIENISENRLYDYIRIRMQYKQTTIIATNKKIIAYSEKEEKNGIEDKLEDAGMERYG